jgi:hypothetical protein
VFFDGARIGSGPPDSTGTVHRDDLAVPGGAKVGSHAVTTSCRATGQPVVHSTAFTVVAAMEHRSGLITALPELGNVNFTPQEVANSLLITIGLFFLIAFPCILFNATLEDHYEEVRGWFGFHHRMMRQVHRVRADAMFVLFLLLGGVLYGLLSPGFGFDRSSLALLLGLMVGLAIVTLGFGLPGLLYMRLRSGDKGELRVLPGTVVLAAVCVLLSRTFNLQPGYLYGLIGGFAYHRHLSRSEEGRMTALASAFMLLLSLGAWAVKEPVSAAAAGPHPGFWVLAVEASLGAVFVLGLESHVFSLLPVRPLPGSRLRGWSRRAWDVLFGLGLLAFVHVLLRPGSGYVADPKVSSLGTVVAIFILTGLLSLAFWCYFRFRTPRQEPEEVEEIEQPV